MKNWKIFILLITIISVGALVALFVYGESSNKEVATKSSGSSQGVVAGATTISNGDYLDNLSKTLNDKGAVLYCSYQSADCRAQKELFGDAFQYINYVECDASGPDANPDECISQKIDAYPTWRYQEQRFDGLQSLANLAKIINFSN